MKRRFVDTSYYESRCREKDGNVDYKFWFDKTPAELLEAAAIMTAVAFNQPNFIKGKVDRSIFHVRKQSEGE